MPRTRKSQRKLERKTAFYDPYLHARDSRIYIGYFGHLLSMLDEDFQDHQHAVKRWPGQMLAEAIEEWHLTPRDPVSGLTIFNILQRHANKNFRGHGTASPLPMQHSEYAAFSELSERLAFGYVDYANYYLRKEQRDSLRRGERYHPSYHTPVELVYLEDHLLYS